MKSKLENIIIFPDYIDSIEKQRELYYQLENKINIFIFDWSKLYKFVDNLSFDDIFEAINKYISSLNIDFKNTILISKGVSIFFIRNIIDNNEFKKVIFINPYCHKGLINPYTNKIPSYKSNINHFWEKNKKEFFKIEDFYSSKEDGKFIDFYNWYEKNYLFFEKLTSLINDTIYLNSIKKNALKFNDNNITIFVGINNKVINIKKTNKFFKNYKIVHFLESSHHIEYEETDKFWKEIFN